MVKPTIVLFCENHEDLLSATAQSFVLNKLDKKKWTHSLVEDNAESTNSFFKNHHRTSHLEHAEQDVLLDYFCQSYSANTCNYDVQLRGPIKTKFLENFIPTYFDTNNRHHMSNTILNCEKLRKLATIETDSKFYQSFKELFSSDFFDLQRNADIVSNLKSMASNLGSNYTIGWAGMYHCVELHHKLSLQQPSLLEKFLFFHLTSQPCEQDVELEMQISLYQDYDFCNATSQMHKDIQRFDTCENDDNEEETDFSLQKENYFRSNNTIVLNLSLSGEPGTMLPWQVADLEIFN